MKIIIPNSIVLVFTAISFLSCDFSHDTITNQVDFEPARYTWEVDTLYNRFVYDGWYYDSNSIYFMTSYNLIKFDGNDYESNYMPYYFASYCISGYDENNIYIGGYTYDRAMLLKWNGSSFTDYIVTDTAEPASNFYSIITMNRDDVWLGCTKGKVYRFDGSSYHPYRFDTSYWYIMPLIKDASNNLYFTGKINYVSGMTVDSTLIEFQKYDNNSWSILYSSIWPGGGYLYPQNAGTDIIAVDHDVIYNFNGSDFIPAIPMKSFLGLDAEVSGSSIGDFITIGYDFQTRKDFIFHWNGLSWSRECEFYRHAPTKLIYCSLTEAYATSIDYERNCTYVYKGRRL
jgi:hypothetical protein